MLFDECSSPVMLTSNDVAPTSPVPVDRRCCQEARADDPVAAGPPPKYSHGPTHVSVDRLSNRDTDPIVALAHDLQPARFVVARYPRHRHRHVVRVPVRFEFTDLHLRFVLSAATYSCPADRLLPTVAQPRYPVPPGPVFRDSSEDVQHPWHRLTDDGCGPVADRRVR